MFSWIHKACTQLRSLFFHTRKRIKWARKHESSSCNKYKTFYAHLINTQAKQGFCTRGTQKKLDDDDALTLGRGFVHVRKGEMFASIQIYWSVSDECWGSIANESFREGKHYQLRQIVWKVRRKCFENIFNQKLKVEVEIRAPTLHHHNNENLIEGNWKGIHFWSCRWIMKSSLWIYYREILFMRL